MSYDSYISLPPSHFIITGQDIGMYVGITSFNFMELYQQIQARVPAVIFQID